jgi:hypothetical protein
LIQEKQPFHYYGTKAHIHCHASEMPVTKIVKPLRPHGVIETLHIITITQRGTLPTFRYQSFLLLYSKSDVYFAYSYRNAAVNRLTEDLRIGPTAFIQCN